jgi:hypothetical protein
MSSADVTLNVNVRVQCPIPHDRGRSSIIDIDHWPLILAIPMASPRPQSEGPLNTTRSPRVKLWRARLKTSRSLRVKNGRRGDGPRSHGGD